MKKLKITSIVALTLLFLTACSKNDNEIEVITGDYFPSTLNNFWNYDVVDSNVNANLEDVLAVDLETSSGFGLEVNFGNDANGAMNSILANGTLKKTESTLIIDGELEVPIEGINGLNIKFEDAILYDLNAAKNEVFSTLKGEFTQDLVSATLTIPLTVSYELTFSKLQNESSIKVGSQNYTNVSSGKISLNLSIIAIIDVQTVATPFTLLEAQDVLSITSYYGENVGLLKSDAVLNFQLDPTNIALLDALGVTVDVPASQSATNTQELTTFTVK